jgi:hypothetical protein
MKVVMDLQGKVFNFDEFNVEVMYECHLFEDRRKLRKISVEVAGRRTFRMHTDI